MATEKELGTSPGGQGSRDKQPGGKMVHGIEGPMGNLYLRPRRGANDAEEEQEEEQKGRGEGRAGCRCTRPRGGRGP